MCVCVSNGYNNKEQLRKKYRDYSNEYFCSPLLTLQVNTNQIQKGTLRIYLNKYQTAKESLSNNFNSAKYKFFLLCFHISYMSGENVEKILIIQIRH